jgi:malonyl CoA-acyl carrier protein transacylase
VVEGKAEAASVAASAAVEAEVSEEAGDVVVTGKVGEVKEVARRRMLQKMAAKRLKRQNRISLSLLSLVLTRLHRWIRLKKSLP